MQLGTDQKKSSHAVINFWKHLISSSEPVNEPGMGATQHKPRLKSIVSVKREL
ncbi:hypothetical protein [Nitrosomonas marina]|uniref:Uncharacterized protein n=1 Tax=Nitrosomonas marina TaxID=917 RepID=A0A1H8EB83_9PROT|nr:hypothetical protein [Nitrosomonas marina]SEN16769.1 hypothetical protein SAMN05216325_10930 [Nitrosomonas marina]